MHTHTHTHTQSVELVWNWDFLPTLSKKLNKVIQIRDSKHITFPSPLCQQGLLWGWTSTPIWQEQDWTGNLMYSSTFPWYQWELFTHTGHQWGRARWHFTSPFPWCHWIGEGKQQGGSELIPIPPCSIKAEFVRLLYSHPFFFFFAGPAHREKKGSYKWYPH